MGYVVDKVALEQVVLPFQYHFTVAFDTHHLGNEQ
jgi:hypothetical protein